MNTEQALTNERIESSDFLTKTYSPNTDIIETTENIQLILDVPGSDKQNVSLQINEGVLEIEANTKKVEESNWIHRGYTPCNYAGKFRLSNQIDSENIDAKVENGVLTITLQKRPESKPKQIAVH